MIKIDEYNNLILNQKETTYKKGSFLYTIKEREKETSKEIRCKKMNGPTVKIESDDTFQVKLKTTLNSYKEIDEMINNLEVLKKLMEEIGLKDDSDPQIKEKKAKEDKDKEMLRKYFKDNNISNPVTEAIYLADLMEYRNGNCKKPDWLTWE